MHKEELAKICDDADMIIKGYAFKRKDSNIQVFNVNDGFSMMVMATDGTLIETNMNEIEQTIHSHRSPYSRADASVYKGVIHRPLVRKTMGRLLSYWGIL